MTRKRIFSFDEKGSALIAAIGVMMVLDLFAVAVLAISASQMTLATTERKTNQAFNVAEAGFNNALWKIDNIANYAPAESAPDYGSVSGGDYKIVVTDVTGTTNQKRVEVTGYVPNRYHSNPGRRKIVAMVEVAPKVLSYGMYAFSWIDIQGATARTYLAPLDYRASDAKGGDMGSNFDIFFNDAAIRLNERGTQQGEQNTYDALFGVPAVPMGDLITAGPTAEVHAVNTVVNTIQELNAKCQYVKMASIKHMNQPITFPTLNFEGAGGYREMAQNNFTNGTKYWATEHSGYFTKADFTALFSGRNNVELTGMIFIDGEVDLPNNKNLTITNGGLVIKDDPNDPSQALSLANRASLIVRHSSEASKVFPGLIVFTTVGSTASVVDRGTMEIEGLVYSERTYSESNSTVRIKGALLASGTSAAASIVNMNASIIIQYDPNVTNMLGLKTFGDVFVKKVTSWREVTP
ncbi:MAG: pilus assembly PilX N-terminal domain-containing protein [Actinomycetota bacterium]